MAIPQIHATTIRNETFGGVTCHLEGEVVPVLHIELSTVPVYFEHHVLLWKHPNVDIGVKSLAGASNALCRGMPIFMTQAKGPGHIAFSRDGVRAGAAATSAARAITRRKGTSIPCCHRLA